MLTNIATGIALASFTDGKQVSTAVTFVLQGNNGGWTTIASDQYDIARANGRVFKRLYDDSDNAVDWSAYTSYRATYALYDPTTQLTTTYTNEAQTYSEFDFFPAVFDPSTGKLNATLLDGLVVTATQFADTIGSDNFSSGVSGWQITRAGDAEFNDVVVRGTIYASAGEITGVLTIGASGGIFQGTGTFGSPTTALKIYNSGGIGLWELWGSGTKQVYANSSGQFVAGGGGTTLDANGISFTADGTDFVRWMSGATRAAYLSSNISGGQASLLGYVRGVSGNTEGYLSLTSQDYAGSDFVQMLLETSDNRMRVVVNNSNNYLTFSDTGFVLNYVSGNAFSFTDSSSIAQITGTAPKLKFYDITASAKSLLLTVDANYAKFDEAGGATSNLLNLDLANGRIGILNASPSVALDLTGAAAISSNLAVDTNTLYVDATNNRVGIGTASPGFPLHVTYTNAANATNRTLIGGRETLTQGASSDFNNIAFDMLLTDSIAATFTNNYTQTALLGTVAMGAAHAGTFSNVRVFSALSDLANGAAGAVTNWSQYYASMTGSATNTTAITNWRGLWVQPGSLNGATITNAYGIFVSDVTFGSTLNYALYTNGGLVHFGDSVDLASGKNISLTLGNIGVATATFGASATAEIAMKNGTAPSGNVTDVFQLYAADQAAGNSAPHFRTENGDVVKIYKGTTFTQTYSTADATLAADGTTDPAAYGAGANGYSSAAMASAVHAAVISLHSGLNDVRQCLNSLIDSLQAQGLVG